MSTDQSKTWLIAAKEGEDGDIGGEALWNEIVDQVCHSLTLVNTYAYSL